MVLPESGEERLIGHMSRKAGWTPVLKRAELKNGLSWDEKPIRENYFVFVDGAGPGWRRALRGGCNNDAASERG